MSGTSFDREYRSVIASAMLSKPQASTNCQSLDPDRQLAEFVDALFEPGDLVEIRGIAPPLPDSKEPGRLALRRWERADSILTHTSELHAANSGGINIYFGVNPRAKPAGTKDAVLLCRTVWADLDQISLADADSRWRDHLPPPTLVVNSGHGIHLYWKLDTPVDVSTGSSRNAFEGLLKNLYVTLGSDSTQDVSRLLRLPGFQNHKGNPVPCELIRCIPGQTYPLSTFERWFVPEFPENPTSTPSRSLREAIATTHISETHDLKRIRGLVAALDKEVDDRSRRDFWVVCRLVELGLNSDEIQTLVAGHSKFTTDAYVKRTIESAFQAVRHQ
jgi:hypothetical protein